MTRTRGAMETGSEVIAALLKGPRSQKDLREQVGLSSEGARKWIRQLRASGVLRVCEYRKNDPTGPGRVEMVFELQSPFARVDVVKPVRISPSRLNRRKVYEAEV